MSESLVFAPPRAKGGSLPFAYTAFVASFFVTLSVGVGFRGLVGWPCTSAVMNAKQHVNKVAGAVTLYQADVDRHPVSLYDLVEVRLLEPKQLSDLWGIPLLYRYPSNRPDAAFDVCSLGEDQVISDDDICND